MSSFVAGRSGGLSALLFVAGVVHGCGGGGEEPGTSQYPSTAVNGAFDGGNTQVVSITPGASNPVQPGASNPVQPGASNPAQPGASNPGVAGSTSNPSGGSVTGASGSSSGLPCNVQKIVAAKCAATCHSDPPVATFMALTKQSYWQQQGTTDKTKKYFELAKVRVNSADKPMPPVVSPQLTADEKATLNAWLNAGAPASSETCADATPPKTDGMTPSDPSAATDTTGLDCYKFLAHAQGDKKAKFKVGTAVDKYMFMGFQAPWQGTVYGVVIKPVIDNSKVLHHWLLYKEDVADGSVMTTLAQHNGGELIHGWAPGGISLDFRRHSDEVSVELPSTTYGLELHYNSSDANALDASGVEVCARKTPTKNLASMTWLGYDQGGLVAYAGICLEPKTTWEGTCKPVSQEPIHLMFMLPHLHQTGRRLKSVINGPNGSRVLHDQPFDFNYQTTYETHEVLMPGETITTTCTFSEAKCAGKATSQEMCYNFTYAWPKHALVDNGPEGTAMHGAGVCLGQ